LVKPWPPSHLAGGVYFGEKVLGAQPKNNRLRTLSGSTAKQVAVKKSQKAHIPEPRSLSLSIAVK
jgi:hypothetical protein